MTSQGIGVFAFLLVIQIFICLINPSWSNYWEIVRKPGRIFVKYGRSGARGSEALGELAYNGVEEFDDLPTEAPFTYTSVFGNGPLSQIFGTYSNLKVNNADVNGGKWGRGKYAGPSPFTLSLRRTGRKGVDFFGFYWSSIGERDTLEFLFQKVSVFNFTGKDAMEKINSGAYERAPYFGNNHWNHWYWGNNGGQAYCFYDFYFNGILFDEIKFGGGTLESDVHTVGYFRDPTTTTTTTTTTSTTTTSTTTFSTTKFNRLPNSCAVRPTCTSPIRCKKTS